MKILHRYIGSTVISMTGLVVLALTGLQAFISFITELHDIGTNSYGVWHAFSYVMLCLPVQVYPLFPVAALIGCLLGLGRLASQSELIVMRGAGVSKTQITGSVIRATVFLLLIATTIGELFGPPLKDFAEQYKIAAEQSAAHPVLREGIWLRDKEDYIFITVALPTGELSGILRYKLNNQTLILASTATSGKYVNNQWVFSNVMETTFYPNHTSTKAYRQQTWPVTFDPKLIGIVDLEPQQTSLFSLYHHIHYLKNNGLSARSYEFNFWQRLLQPLATLVMIGLAVPFIFGPLRTVTMGLRILIGVVIGFGFYTLNQFLGPFSLVYQVPPVLAAAVPIILFAMIDAILLWKVK